MQFIEHLISFLFGLGLFVNAFLFIPQGIKLYRTKDAKDLSKITFVGFCIIQLLAILYGLIHNDWVLVIGYGASIVTCGTVTVMSFIYTLKDPNK